MALFAPGSKRIVGVYQGIRQSEHMANWINQVCPKIEIKEEEKNDNENNKKEGSLEIDLENINQMTEITGKNEYIKNKFFEIKKRLDEIDKTIQNHTNTTNTKTEFKAKKHKKLRITFEFTFINIVVTGITLLIIFAFYQTGRKLLFNSQFHQD